MFDQVSKPLDSVKLLYDLLYPVDPGVPPLEVVGLDQGLGQVVVQVVLVVVAAHLPEVNLLHRGAGWSGGDS